MNPEEEPFMSAGDDSEVLPVKTQFCNNTAFQISIRVKQCKEIYVKHWKEYT